MKFSEWAQSAMRVLAGENAGAQYDWLAQLTRDKDIENVRGMYELLRDLYHNDTAYTEEDNATVIGHRNPARALVEFYVSTVWPGALPEALPIVPAEDVPDPDALRGAIEVIWEWSNWSTEKQVFVRTTAMLGDGLLKVETHQSNRTRKVDRVYLRSIRPDDLTDFDVDERGFFTYLRLDVPQTRRLESGEKRPYTHTEVWDKAAGTMRIWEHERGLDAKLTSLGEPLTERLIQKMVGDDYIPFVHVKHSDVGAERGMSAVGSAMVKAYQVSRMASRLYDLMFAFGKPDVVLESNLTDEDGQPMIPPQILDPSESGGQLITWNDIRMWQIPGGWTMRAYIPDVPYEQLRAALTEYMQHLKQGDFPELAYYEVTEGGNQSGKALRITLTPATAKAEDVRGAHESGLARALQMAMSIGKFHGLEKFKNLGDYHAGQLAHRFESRSVLPLPEDEEANVGKTRAETNAIKLKYGYGRRFLLGQDGLSAQEIKENFAETDDEEAAQAGASLLDREEDDEARQILELARSRES